MSERDEEMMGNSTQKCMAPGCRKSVLDSDAEPFCDERCKMDWLECDNTLLHADYAAAEATIAELRVRDNALGTEIHNLVSFKYRQADKIAAQAEEIERFAFLSHATEHCGIVQLAYDPVDGFSIEIEGCDPVEVVAMTLLDAIDALRAALQEQP